MTFVSIVNLITFHENFTNNIIISKGKVISGWIFTVMLILLQGFLTLRFGMHYQSLLIVCRCAHSCCGL